MAPGNRGAVLSVMANPTLDVLEVRPQLSRDVFSDAWALIFC